MPSYTVGASTSIVLLDTSSLGAGDKAIVYLSTPTTPGQIVTVRDSLGYLSSPQAILVSTTSGVAFNDGTSSIQISQPFASLSFSGAPPFSWNIINTFGFPLYDTVATVRNLTASTLTGQAITIGGGLSTGAVVANTLTVTSTAAVQGPLYASSLIVGAPAGTDPAGNAAYIVGSAAITSNLAVGGSLTVGQSTSIGGNLYVTSNLTIGGATTFGAGLTVGGNVATSGSLTAGSLTANSTATILGAATFNSNVTVTSNLTVNQTATTSNVTTSTLTVNTGGGGYLQLGSLTGPRLTAGTIAGQAAASWNAPFFAPYISSGTVEAAGSATVSTLIVTGSISAPTVTTVALGNAAVTAGSLAVTSVTANTLTLSNTFTTDTLAVSSLLASSVTVAGSVAVISPIGFVSAATATVSSVVAGQISTGLVNAGVILTPALSVSSLFVAQTIDGGTSMTTFSAPAAAATFASLAVNSANVGSMTASTITVTSGIITSPSTIRIQASTVQLDTTYISSLTASTLQASTIQATRVVIGAPLAAGSNGPDFYYDPTPATSTNVLVTGGPGDYLSPYFLSNVIPVGQNPAVPYTTFISFETDFKGQPPPPGLLIEYSATLFWAGQVNSQLAITGGPTLLGLSGTNTSTTGTLAQSTFRINAQLYGASAISVNFNYRYTPNANYIDSNAAVVFNNGRLYWNYALNGTTIQNSLNDMTTRNLYYYGSLNFASDPRIKEGIKPADLGRCADIVRELPLHTYTYTDAYCSTFRTPQTQRIGLLATELAEVFPHSVQASDIPLPDGSGPMLTIDTSQVEMAHLGATKHLMAEVARLERALEALETGRLSQ